MQKFVVEIGRGKKGLTGKGEVGKEKDILFVGGGRGKPSWEMFV